MLELVISDDAEQDLIDIWNYIAEDNPINATRFLRKIADKYHWLSENNEAGVNRDEFASGLMKFSMC